jgi:transposase
MVVLLSIVLYGFMEHIYSSRALAKACRQNINFMWLLPGNRPPSHRMINAFRKHLLREVIEKLFAQVFIDGTMLEAQANCHTAVWRKNVENIPKNPERVHEKAEYLCETERNHGETQQFPKPTRTRRF